MGYRDLFTVRPLSFSFSHSEDDADVYLLGVPFDSTTSYRPGTRFGPNSIREALANIEFNSILNGKSLEDVKINDLGNMKSTTNPDVMIDTLGKVMGEVVSRGRLIGVLGGEHLLTLASYNSIKAHEDHGGDVMLIVFDAHLDLRDEFNDCKLNHATYLHRIVEDNGDDGSNVLHIGARGYSKDELEYARSTKVNIIYAKDILLDHSNAIKRFKDLISTYDYLYVSIDLDGIDPAYAKGVGTPEPFGLTPVHMLGFLSSLSGKRLKGFDVVELCPPCDDGSTAILAAKLMLELILLNVY
jgi:agmatinase